MILSIKKKMIQSKILNWKGKIPSSNIQRNARNIRYSLLSEYCFKKNIKYLITAHHMDDQIENFFIRLFRGSGLKGLSSLEIKNTEENKGINLLRPLLDEKKEDLIFISKAVFKKYFLEIKVGCTPLIRVHRVHPVKMIGVHF